MPPIREHVVLDDLDTDDMPLLVDNPNPSMTYTFFTDMTPVSFANTDPTDTTIPALLPSPSIIHADPLLAVPPPSKGSHAKKRDASYIPRPPNAFILFRSSFIRSQQVTGKVEGNHSNLSKIIGMYWKTLPREEREQWEAKAVAAQAEHRKRYPDWRFRPGANAMAKLKIKDGGPNASNRRRRSRIKDPPDGSELEEFEGDLNAGDKAKGKARAKIRDKAVGQEERRCAKIADLLVEGKKGAELEVAVEEWEGDRKSARKKWKAERAGVEVGESAVSSAFSPLLYKGQGYSLTTRFSSDVLEDMEGCPTPSTDTSCGIQRETSLVLATSSSDLRPNMDHSFIHHSRHSRSRSPDRDYYSMNAFENVPLTHMFKRSLSAPASHFRLPYARTTPDFANTPIEGAADVDRSPTPLAMVSSAFTFGGHSHGHARRDTVSFPMHPSDFAPRHQMHTLTWQEEEERRRYESAQDHGYWWGTDSEEGAPSDSAYEPLHDTTLGSGLDMEGMAYDDALAAPFDHETMEHFSSSAGHPHPDGSHLINWTTIPGRRGLVAAIEDPYMHPKRNASRSSSPSSSTPPPPVPAPIPASSPPIGPLEDANTRLVGEPGLLHYPLLSPLSPFPSSSFSTLSGWAGDYGESWSSSPAVARVNMVERDAGQHQDVGWRTHILSLGLQGGAAGQWENMDVSGDAGGSRSERRVAFEDEDEDEEALRRGVPLGGAVGDSLDVGAHELGGVQYHDFGLE